MLAIISDLHLSDGSTANNVHPSAFTEILFPEVAENAKEKKAKEIWIVLLGDIVDLVRTDYWSTIPWNERPWNGTLDSQTALNSHDGLERHYQHVLRSILRQPCSKGLFSGLNSLRAHFPKKTIKVTYVIGNHDRALHNFPSLQSLIAGKIDKSYDVTFQTNVLTTDYGLLARHGHEWQDHDHGYRLLTEVLQPGTALDRFSDECYRVQTMGEVVTAELMAGLVIELKKSSGAAGLAEKVKDVNNIRPITDSFGWLEWIAQNRLSDKEKGLVLDALSSSLQNVLDTELAKTWDKIKRGFPYLYGDLIDDLEDALRILKKSSFNLLHFLSGIYLFLERKLASSKDCLVKGAEKEWSDALSSDVQYIVYGHAHEARRYYVEGDPDDRVKLYINTGTYLPLIQQCEKEGFYSSHQMTMTFFYRSDEDKKDKLGNLPTVDMWEGSKRKTYQAPRLPRQGTKKQKGKQLLRRSA